MQNYYINLCICDEKAGINFSLIWTKDQSYRRVIPDYHIKLKYLALVSGEIRQVIEKLGYYFLLYQHTVYHCFSLKNYRKV